VSFRTKVVFKLIFFSHSWSLLGCSLYRVHKLKVIIEIIQNDNDDDLFVVMSFVIFGVFKDSSVKF